MSDRNTILIDWKYFLSYLQPKLFDTKGVNIDSAYTKNVYIKKTYIEGINAISY